jgi:hypothetical protein
MAQLTALFAESGQTVRVLVLTLAAYRAYRDVFVTADDRPAEDDDTLVDEAVEERGVLFPGLLLTVSAGGVPVRPPWPS